MSVPEPCSCIISPSTAVVSLPALATGATLTVTTAESAAEFCTPSFTVSQNVSTESDIVNPAGASNVGSATVLFGMSVIPAGGVHV